MGYFRDVFLRQAEPDSKTADQRKVLAGEEMQDLNRNRRYDQKVPAAGKSSGCSERYQTNKEGGL